MVVGVRPTGTVTFLFTDIVGSTRWWEDPRVEMATALAFHDDVLRRVVGRHGGVVFSTAGDGVAAVFDRAISAVAAASELQLELDSVDWPDPVRLVVRVGLHTGEAEERAGDYFGPAVNLAARVMAAADGGHVLLTSPTAEIVRGALPAGLALVDVGDRELRSLARPARLFELTWPGSPAPSAAAPRARVGSFPRLRRALIGRDAEVEQIAAKLSESSLVTLVGPGGIGKTSLALAVGRVAAASFADGVWFCELAEVAEPGAVASVVTATLGLRAPQGTSALEQIVAVLTAQSCLLVLDNSEHVVDAAGELADAVMAGCPDVRVLATSREPLGVPGEVLVAVSPLASDAAVALFRERAADHGLHLGPGNDEVVSDMCAQLDRMPLALELAAAQLRTIPLAELARRLDQRLRLLRGQRRTVSRHQTLHALVVWSYELLEGGQQQVFDRLSVFSGGFTLSAAEEVCADDTVETVTVAGLIASLVDKSMVVIGPTGRYAILETLRQFGEERLEATGGTQAMRDAHLRWARSFTALVHDGLLGRDEERWWDALRDEFANLRAAFNSAIASDDLDAAADLTANMLWGATWHDITEPFAWAEILAGRPGIDTRPGWCHVLAGEAIAAWDRGDLTAAIEHAHAAFAAEPPGVVNVDCLAEGALVSATLFQSDPTETHRYLDQLVRRARTAGWRTVEAAFGVAYAVAAADPVDGYNEATNRLQAAEDLGNPNAVAFALAVHAALGALLEQPGAKEDAERAWRIGERIGALQARSVAGGALARLAEADGRVAEAAEWHARRLAAFERPGSWMYVGQILIDIVGFLARHGHTELAASLHGAVHASTSAGSPALSVQVSENANVLRSQLGLTRSAELIAEGQDMSIAEAATRGRSALDAVRNPPK